MVKAEVAKPFAITSTTRPVSEASKPKALKVEPAILADSAKSFPVAIERFKVASVAFNISVVVKPNFANSVCKAATSVAVLGVVAPNLLAAASMRSIS